MNFVSRNISVVDLTTDTVIAVGPHRPTCRRPARMARADPGRRGDVLLRRAATSTDRRAPRSRPTSGCPARAGRTAPAATSRADRRRGLGVRLRPAQVGAAERHLQSAQPRRAADPQLLGDLRRGAGLRGQHPQHLRPRAPGRRRALQRAAAGPRAPIDPNHGLLIGDNGNINLRALRHQPVLKANADRQQVTVTLPGSTAQVQALDALKHWVQFAVRVPNGPLTSAEVAGGVPVAQIQQGRALFSTSSAPAAIAAGCGARASRTSPRRRPTTRSPARSISAPRHLRARSAPRLRSSATRSPCST